VRAQARIDQGTLKNEMGIGLTRAVGGLIWRNIYFEGSWSLSAIGVLVRKKRIAVQN
jgi:hypothetical protein